MTISLKDAIKVAKDVIDLAESEDDEPIAITIIGINGEVIVQLAMDNVMLVSVELSKNKAYTALMTKRETAFWAAQEGEAKLRLLENFTNKRFTFFPGGIPVENDKGEIIAAVGISGRKGQRIHEETHQDHELAQVAINALRKINPI